MARSSMADDLRLGRVTEIDALRGEVCRLAQGPSRAAPPNARTVDLISAGADGATLNDGTALRRALGI
jgi:2-dehydropantoate 2-reductase